MDKSIFLIKNIFKDTTSMECKVMGVHLDEVEVGEEDTHDEIIASQFSGLLQTVNTFRAQLTTMQHQIRGLERTVKKELRSLKRNANKGKGKGNRKPSGFAKPATISDDLCVFMEYDAGTQVARTEVTKFIIRYIKDNNLQYSENKKIIKPDDKLRNLLGVKNDEEVNYFNLQKFMNQHFDKNKDKDKSKTSMETS